VRHLVRREYDVLVVKERGAQQVAQCVVLLVEGEDGRVGLACVLLHGDFGLAVAEEEELKAIWGVHLERLVGRGGLLVD